MLALLSPAKSLDFDTPLPTRRHTVPTLLGESEALIDVLRGLSVADVGALMDISEELAALNAQRYAEFTVPFTPANARPAVFAFAGDVYQGMDPRRFDTRDLTRAQKTVRILSGLYGVLRPLDLVQPYRLEMGTRLRTERGASLYAWWGRRITDALRDDLAASPGADAVVNLASQEYFGAVDVEHLAARVISPRFEDTSARGQRSVVSFYAKRARGAMAAWLVQQRVQSVAALRGFDAAGYRFDADASTADQPVFVRRFEDRPAPAGG
ncbi:peroxide stress protein YaaA [Propioniciclava soli]|uniref:peroxide stress protein YaaA n=1 Tax=Propioniciclava soli TaxID=2775081 RepID=UPI001E59DD1A|nr:peroxide stress protein YaaA [Propioniciclava soli]